MSGIVRAVGRAAFRLLLWLHPPRHRRRFGPSMAADFEDRLADGAARGAAWQAWRVARALADSVVSAASEWISPSDDEVRSRPRRLDVLCLDARFAVRTLVRRPGFTAVAVLTLALGAGATTAIFSAVDAVLFRPLPLEDPDRLVMLWETDAAKGWTHALAAPANIADWREQVHAFRAVTSYGPGFAAISGGGPAEIVPATFVTDSFFDVLGVRAAHGRTFRPGEMWSDAAPVVVISDALWARRFGRDPAILGALLRVDEEPHEVVGIMPPDFPFPAPNVELWLPIGWDRTGPSRSWFRVEHFLRAVARLEDGVTVEEADAELRAVARRLEAQHPGTNAGIGAGLTPLREFQSGEARAPLLILFGASTMILLLACANVANLLLARAGGRGQEMAVRRALGAAPARIVALLLTESVLLAAAGGIAGIALATVTLRLMRGFDLPAAMRLDDVALDVRVLAFALGLTVITGVCFGLAPALRGASAAARGGTRTTHSRRSRRVAQGLVVAQVALALMLASAAGLLLRSYVGLGQVHPGFAVEDRVVASILLPPRYASDSHILAFVDALTARIEAIPGVRGVTYGSRLPFTGTGERLGSLVVEGVAGVRYDGDIGTRLVAPDWFDVLAIPLLSGRSFTDADRAEGERVVVINESLARRIFSREDPVGRRIGWTESADEPVDWQRIVGVVGDEHQVGMRVAPQPEAFTSFRQLPSRRLRLIVHADVDLRALAPALRAALAGVDAELPLADLQPLEARYATLFGGDRLLLALIGAFAALALVLAGVGVYGLMAELVAARMREVGIRLALGAATGTVARSIFAQGLALAGLGVLIGLAGAGATAHLLSAVLFGVAPTDAPTFAAVTVLLIVAALLACAVPALRAARVEPGTVLRQD